MTESALPDSPVREGKKEQRADTTKKEGTTVRPKEETKPILRNVSQNHAGETVHLDDFEESDEGPEYQGGIPVQKPGVKINQIIAYETKDAYRALAPNRVE